ncbi:MAG: ribose-5-phosphate isomerase RpiA [Gemmatimonadetes bacterium]|nr:ribose-5-phosphate isomerase RpiA [Gemmatimonadota bacterium]MYD26731.1 ribose-5-phosphate isomerase RpiA [Gemmatimonadota bacterium]MYI99163.1 ribose-5-phosphate isomerase RpiA [Gemmatimonadota bacterium]
MSSENLTRDMKRTVGIEAARMVGPGDVVGLGTGSTAEFMIEELGRRVREEQLDIVGIPTSFDASVLARGNGIPTGTLDDVDRVDIAVDGADEVDPAMNLIKGRGAAHLREKIVDGMAERFIVIVDESKLVERLGTQSPVPLEVLPMAVQPVMRAVETLGAEPVLRMAAHKDGPVITDQGNMVVDARFDGIDDSGEMERVLNNVPGILENGLFVGLATEVLVGRITGEGNIEVERRTRVRK